MSNLPDSKTDLKVKPKRRSWGRLGLWLWTAVVVLVVFEAMVANNQATNGQQLADLQEKQSNLSLQVSDLERQVAVTGSLQNIRQKATDQLGLQPVQKNVLYLNWPVAEEVH